MALLSEIAMMVFEDASPASVTVHVEVPAAVKDEGEQVNPDSPVGAAKLICVERVAPFRLAVRFAVWLVAMEPALAVKTALLAPDGIDTVPGVVSDTLSFEITTVVVPSDLLSKVTVQFAL